MTENDAVTARDFSEFFRAVHGFTPFTWQTELVAHVLDSGSWPELVDVPTGLGKTAMLDVGIFVAAATAGVDGPGRTGRRRLFFVVDRRLVVDEAYVHARRLSDAVQRAAGGTDALSRVAAGLRTLAPQATGELLPVTRMRGGTTWAAAWLDRPDRPAIVLGTVDQLGSRLLFRGYGVSDRRRPLDAALVGTDSLVMVDEAHLATALLRTVEAAQARDRLGLPLPGLALTRLSATAQSPERTYRLDGDAHRSDPVAWQRLTAGKRLTLRETTAKNCPRELARIAVDHIDELTGDGRPAPAVLIVCNTVDRARETHARVRAALSRGACELLIGRARPIDRPGLQDRILDLLGTGRSPAQEPAVLVATQTVEVGVNLDADVLVTESASWDALVQRLGRLNRSGTFSARFPGRAAAAIVVHDGQADGPVYGSARDTTWAALTPLAGPGAEIDVSPLACRELSETTFAADGFTRAPGDVPILLTPTLDAWVQTGPVPLGDPPVAPFLHGFDGGTTPVQVVWRDGLLHSDPLDDPFDDGDAERAAPQVDALLTQWPPRTPEIAEVPFGAVLRWMSGQAAGPVGDVDITEDDPPRTSSPAEPFRVLAQRPSRAGRSDAPSRWLWIEHRQLRPGDRIVVPVERGGLDQYGWAPADRTRVIDVSEAAAFTATRSRREATLRLDTTLTERLGIDTGEPAVETAWRLLVAAPDPDEPVGPAEINAASHVLAEHLPGSPPPGRGWDTDAWASLRAWLGSGRLRIVEVHDPTVMSFTDEPATWARLLAGPRPQTGSAGTADGPVVEGDDDEVAASSVAEGSVTLEDHHAAVRRRAAEITRTLRLPEALRVTVEDAAGWHDLGKLDDRFQTMLHGGDPVEAALATEPLAKSGLDQTDRLSWRHARQLSRLPAGARHEAWSAALVEQYLDDLGQPYPGDADLLLHLVASHHGHSRPFARLVHDPDPRPIRAVLGDHKVSVGSERTVSLDHPARFQALNRTYGRWGLALLESIVRCADTTVSGEGS